MIRLSVFSLACTTVLTASVAAPAPAQAPAGSRLTCDLSAYRPNTGPSARMAGNLLTVEWGGTAGERVRIRLGRHDGRPRIAELALAPGNGEWVRVASDMGIEVRVVEGFRRISNQQLQPLRELGVPLTQEIVDKYKWDVFWDAPLEVGTGGGRSNNPMGGNPPPANGVANQPGLPRSPDEIRRAGASYTGDGCKVTTDGRRLTIAFSGLTLGSFKGELVLTAYDGTNLIRVEAIASTALPSVAYKYDVGLTSLPIGAASRVVWRDVANQEQAYALRGPANADPVPLHAANRLVVAEANGAAIAAFPPPHTFFWAREVEVNAGYDWYRKDSATSFSFGIRQAEREPVERYRENWSLYSAPPGSKQHMAALFYPTLGAAAKALSGALAFTNGDVYRALPGYQVLGTHYHTDFGRTLMATGSVDSRLQDFEALRAAGINIAGPVDRPREATQIEEQRWEFEGAVRHSDQRFMVLPEMENSNLLGGHWDLLFSHPVFYVDDRPAGTPVKTPDPKYGVVWHIGNADDMIAMIEAENMLVYMPHPRTKGSTGYPDAIKDARQFRSDWYRGVGWRWGMGSDLSEARLSEHRVIPLLDDMNNWIAGSSLKPKYLLPITETYSKAPGDDIYAAGPVGYLRLARLPEGDDYSPIINALKNGEYFVTSGEVLIPSHRYEGSGASMALVAEVEWTFPLDFVEVVAGDGKTTRTWKVSATDQSAFGKRTFRIPFDGTGQAWVRFAAWDCAGNGAMTMPVRIGN